MGLIEKLKQGIVLYDGSTGSYLQEHGLTSGESTEEWNLSHPDVVRKMFEEFIDAGSQMIQADTFCANGPTLEAHGLKDKLVEINEKAAELALSAAQKANVLVAASIGPTGLYFEPAGHLDFEMAVEIFKEQLAVLKKAGITVVNFETFMDINEMRAAIMAAKELGGVEIISSMTFQGERTMNGTPADACAVSCAALGVDVVGANCSAGPGSLYQPLEAMGRVTALPLSAKPNAGLPEVKNGKTIYSLDAAQFAERMLPFAQNGVRLLGGCCGTMPPYIAALKAELAGKTFDAPERKGGPYISSPLGVLDLARKDLTFSYMEFPQIMDDLVEDDFMSVSDILPVDWESSDACILDFQHLTLDFSVEKLVQAVTLFLKKPVIVRGGSSDVVELFLRYYPGRAGLVTRKHLPDRTFGAQIVSSSFRPVEEEGA